MTQLFASQKQFFGLAFVASLFFLLPVFFIGGF